MDTELLIVTIVKALVELAGFFLLGRGLLHLLAGKKREQNLAYQILCVLTGPVIRVTRGITPKGGGPSYSAGGFPHPVLDLGAAEFGERPDLQHGRKPL